MQPASALRPGQAAEFSRGTQHWGGMVAAVIFGVRARPRARRHRRRHPPSDRLRTEFGRVAKVATAAFVAVVLIPAMKYPPNPPTVGDPDTIGERTTAYLTLTAASIVIVFAAWYLWQYLTDRGLDRQRRLPRRRRRVRPDGDAGVSSSGRRAPMRSTRPTTTPARPAGRRRGARQGAGGHAGQRPGHRRRRDPRPGSDPEQPLDLSTVTTAPALAGAPVAVSTTKLVPHSYTTTVWHFRMRVARRAGPAVGGDGGRPRPAARPVGCSRRPR